MLDKKSFVRIFFRETGGNIPSDNGEPIHNVSNDVPDEIPPVETGPSRQDSVEKEARNADNDDFSKLGSR